MNQGKKCGGTKRQHYVPQFILRKFSKDGKTVSLFVLESGMRIDKAQISRQCYEDYFYGKDGDLEAILSTMEYGFSSIIGDLSPAALNCVTKDQLEEAKLFVQFQRARTATRAKEYNDAIDTMMKTIFSDEMEIAGLNPNSFHIGTTGPQYHALLTSISTAPILSDLSVKFLIASAGSDGFVIGNHPVTAYNQFAERHPILKRYDGTTGIACKGLQIFFPISSSVCMAIYDPGVYAYGGGAGRTLGITPRDVELLNVLQALNSDRVYFNGDTVSDSALQVLAMAKSKAPARQAVIRKGQVTPRQDGNFGQLIQIANRDVRIGAEFDFARVVDKLDYAEYNLAIMPVRSEDLLHRTLEHAERLRNEIKNDGKE